MTERQADRVQRERWERGRLKGWISRLFFPPLSSLALPGAWCLASRVIFFHNKHCHPCISIFTVAVCVRLADCSLRVLLCRDLGRLREGSRAETLTWHRWDPPCQPVALCRLVTPKHREACRRERWKKKNCSCRNKWKENHDWWCLGTSFCLINNALYYFPLFHPLSHPLFPSLFHVSSFTVLVYLRLTQLYQRAVVCPVYVRVKDQRGWLCGSLSSAECLRPNYDGNIHQISIRARARRLIKCSNAAVGQQSRYSLMPREKGEGRVDNPTYYFYNNNFSFFCVFILRHPFLSWRFFL